MARQIRPGQLQENVSYDISASFAVTASHALNGGGGGGTPGGSDTQVQFNDGGSFGGDSGFTFNKTTNSITAITDITSSGNIIVSGDVSASNLYIGTGKIYGNEAYNNYLTFNASSSLFKVQNKTYIKFDGGSAQREITVNEGTNDIDFVVKGDSNNPLFKTDSATNRIGTHGKGSPEVDFHIGGDELRVDGNISGSSAIFDNNVSASKFYAADGLYHSDDVLENTHITFPTGDKVQITAGDVNFIHAHQVDADINKLTFNDDNTDTDIIFRGAVGSNNNLLRLDASAMKIGIGTGTPSEALTVEGNISGSGNLKIDGSQVDFTNLPTSDPGVAGRLYNDSGTIKISL